MTFPIWAARRRSGGYTKILDPGATEAGNVYNTVAALEAAGIVAGDRIGIAAGSTFREQLDITVNNVTVEKFGAGDNPIFNAADVQANASFAKTDGYDNIYEISVTLDGDGTGDWVNAWEDGAFLAREAFDTDLATTLTALDANPGACYPTAETGTITLYIHASDSSDVTANSKVYECSVREYGISGENNLTLTNVECKNNLSENGSMRAGRYLRATGCTFRNGSKHNAYAEDGAILTTCTFIDAYYTAAANLFVANENTPVSAGVSLIGCTFEMTAYNANIGGFFCHKNTSGSFGAVSISSCTFENLNVAIEGVDFASMAIISPTFTECTICVRGSVAVTYTMSSPTQTATIDSALFSSNVAGSTLVLTSPSSAIVGVGTTGNVFANHNNTTITITGGSMAATGLGAANGMIHVNTGKTGCVVTINGLTNTINTGSNYRFLAAPTYVGDNNIFSRGGGEPRFNLGANTYTSLADWKTATSQDANSTVA